jgi:hypothetical protein
MNLFVADSKTHSLGKSCRLTLTIAQRDRTLLDLIKEGLIKAGKPADKIHIRFDGKVYRLKLNDTRFV